MPLRNRFVPGGKTMSWEAALPIILSTAFLVVAVVLYLILRRFKPVRRVVISWHLLAVLLAFRIFTLLAAASPLAKDLPWISESRFNNVLNGVLIVFGVMTLLRAADAFLVEHLLGSRLEVRISSLARHLVIILLIAGTIIVVLSAYGVEITGLVATSAVASAVIGLALQDTLGNLIAGIALQSERSFKSGDWIRVGDLDGRVIEMTWRTTRLSTLDDDLVIVPNSMLARERIRNFQVPTTVQARRLSVGVEYGAPPARVKAVLAEAAAGAECVLADPAPRVRLISFGDFAVTYEIKYWIDRYAEREDIADRVMTRVWYLLRRHRISIPFPIRDVHMHPAAEHETHALLRPHSDEVRALLRSVELLRPLSDDEVAEVADSLDVELYTAGEELVRQGEPGDSFFFIAEGHVSVRIDGLEVAKLGPRDYFGEMSLLTGEPRGATVVALVDTQVLAVDRACFETVLRANPAVAEALAKTLERLSAENVAKLQARGVAVEAAPKSAGFILDLVRKLFRLG
jgi:small-conductance mechanosensitive channel/CRP-like cAMP-binding protein